MSERSCLSAKRRSLALLLPSLVGALAGYAAASATAQEPLPGDIIVERQVMPRDAFHALPKQDNPVVTRATTFPTPTFDASIGTLLSDVDLINARGSAGVTPGANVSAASLQALDKLVGGSAAASNVPVAPVGLAQPMAGLGATVSTTVTGALAPLGAILGGQK